jgi:hypothetical protein
MTKKNGMAWDRRVPIGGQVTIVNIKARKDLNGEFRLLESFPFA